MDMYMSQGDVTSIAITLSPVTCIAVITDPSKTSPALKFLSTQFSLYSS